jgi:hypothetical protein
MNAEKKSYPITVMSGLLDPKHIEKIGAKTPLWAYLWFLWQRKKNKKGWVCGGNVLKYEELAKKLCVSLPTLKRYIDTLRGEYIEVERSCYGVRVKILKPKPISRSINPDTSHSRSIRTDTAEVSELIPPISKREKQRERNKHTVQRGRCDLAKFFSYVDSKILPQKFNPGKSGYAALLLFARHYKATYGENPKIVMGKHLKLASTWIETFGARVPVKIKMFFSKHKVTWIGANNRKTVEIFNAEIDKIDIRNKDGEIPKHELQQANARLTLCIQQDIPLNLDESGLPKNDHEYDAQVGACTDRAWRELCNERKDEWQREIKK